MAKEQVVAAWIHTVTEEGSTWTAGAGAAAASAAHRYFSVDHDQMVTRQTLVSWSGCGIARGYMVVVALSWPSFPGFLYFHRSVKPCVQDCRTADFNVMIPKWRRDLPADVYPLVALAVL